MDPARLQFAYGSGATARVQMIRDVTGCSVGCGAFSGGRVTIPPGTPITVAVPVTGNPSKVSFVQPDQPVAECAHGIRITIAARYLFHQLVRRHRRLALQ